jgi:hypothetical protein
VLSAHRKFPPDLVKPRGITDGTTLCYDYGLWIYVNPSGDQQTIATQQLSKNLSKDNGPRSPINKGLAAPQIQLFFIQLPSRLWCFILLPCHLFYLLSQGTHLHPDSQVTSLDPLFRSPLWLHLIKSPLWIHVNFNHESSTTFFVCHAATSTHHALRLLRP